MPEEPNTKGQLQDTLQAVRDLTEAIKSKQAEKGKDQWDKFNALSPFVTGFIVAIVGGLFTLSQDRRNEILKQQEIDDGKRQAAQDVLTKEHQVRILELQTIGQFMPYLTSKDENKKQVAITAVNALSNTSLAIELARLNKSPGTINAVRQIATQSAKEVDRKLAQAALVELEKPTVGPNRTLLKTEEGECGPEGEGGDKATNLLKNRTDLPKTVQDLTIENLEKLPVLDVPFRRDEWTPAATENATGLGEGQGVRVQGYLLRAKRESRTTANCASLHYVDWHLVLGQAPQTPQKGGMIAVAGPRIRISHPNWTLERLQMLAAAEVSVRVTGWLFFDQQHLPQDKSDRLRFRATPWEVRPVVKIEFLQDQSWLDLDDSRVVPPKRADSTSRPSGASQ
jgi:hypothetical protein